MSVLIAGAAGFIGSSLVDRFLSMNFQVVGIDNFITGQRSNLDHLKDNPNFIFYEHDIIKPINIPYKLSYILHLASPASPNRESPTSYFNKPFETMLVNTTGTINLLELARANNARFLFFSTSEIYGDPLVSPQPEHYTGNIETTSPRSVYDESKRFGETITMTYNREYGVNTAIVRLFNCFGKRFSLTDGRVLPNLIQNILNNEPLEVYGSGDQTRSFCYIDDSLDGIIKLLFSEEHYPVNIGSPNEVTILEFAKILDNLNDNKTGIIFKDSRSVNDPQRRCADITKAKKLLNWASTTTLEEGLAKTLTYYKSLK